MKTDELKRLVTTYSLEQLSQAESILLEEGTPEIEIHGADEGEKLTHVIGAIWILKEMQKEAKSMNECLRLFVNKVRNSIS